MYDIIDRLYKKSFVPLKEKTIKCIVVGDTSVGKTRLVGSYVFNEPKVDVSELYHQCHTPSIFSSDFMTNHQKLYFGSVPIKLSIWDTFGNHERNREYSYKNADVAIICFDIGNPDSLESVVSVWINEVKYYCPKIPILLVGTQLDKRHTDSIYLNKKTKIKTLRQYLNSDITTDSQDIQLVDSETARGISTKIGATMYMEVSISTKYGVNLLFYNAAKLGLMKRIGRNRKSFQNIMLQKPYLPSKDIIPEIKIPAINTDEILSSNVFSPNTQIHTTNVVFQLHNGALYGNSLVLSLGSSLFKTLFSTIRNIQEKDNIKEQDNNFSYERALVNGTECMLPRGFQSVDITSCDHRTFFEIKIGKIDIDEFRQILEFYYTGEIKSVSEANQLLLAANYLQVDLAFEYASNVITAQPHDELHAIKEYLCTNILKSGKRLLSHKFHGDVVFNVDGSSILCHTILLRQRCKVFEAMLHDGSFLESKLSEVDFRHTNLESFLAVLEYLYTGECHYYGDLHGTLQLANFLCLPRFVALCEDEIVKYITELHACEDREVSAAVLASYNIAQFHNAPQLSEWCLHFMATNYNDLCKDQTKEIKSLDDTTLKYLEEHRWPPVWYLKEQDYYERTMKQLEQEQRMKKNRKQQRKYKTCF